MIDVKQNRNNQSALVAALRQRLQNDDMTRHSVLMVIFSVLAGFFTYLYQLLMGILLEPQQYGILFSLTSLLVMIIMVFSQAFSTTVAKFASGVRADGKSGHVQYLRHFFLRKGLLIGIVTFVLLTALSPLISRFLGIINPFYTLILFSSTLIVFVFAANQGILGGLQRFLLLGATMALQSFLHMAIGVLLVYLGFGIYGGLAAYSLSYLIVLPLSFLLLRKLLGTGREPVAISGVNAYAGHVLLSILAITVLTNIDAVLAKHYLTAVDASNYAAISVMGRIALYVPMGISAAMFPKTALLFESGGDHLRVFWKAIFLTLFLSGSVLLVYTLFSQVITGFLFGGKYPLLSEYLVTYSLAMAVFGFCTLNMRYLLSINRTGVSYALLMVMILQIALIAFFHDSISQMVDIMLISSFVCLASLLVFHLKRRRG